LIKLRKEGIKKKKLLGHLKGIYIMFWIDNLKKSIIKLKQLEMVLSKK
jgi:hypothetical protein